MGIDNDGILMIHIDNGEETSYENCRHSAQGHCNTSDFPSSFVHNTCFFTKEAAKLVTDSGGLRKEAYILGTDTVTVRDQTEWEKTLDGNHNVLCKPQKRIH